jgi:hypothetical protein
MEFGAADMNATGRASIMTTTKTARSLSSSRPLAIAALLMAGCGGGGVSERSGAGGAGGDAGRADRGGLGGQPSGAAGAGLSGGTPGGTGGGSGVGGVSGVGGHGGTGSAAGASGRGGVSGTPGSGGSPGVGGRQNSAGTTGTGGTPPPPLAFPGAQGFGKHATGARNGVVYHVTNLNDAGAGSFRDAVGTPNRFVIFDVGGYIQLATAVSVKSNITIAGQTAPGGGIGFRGGEISFANSSNIICRFIRVRPGSETASDEDDALSLYRARNVMIDHASFEFGPWNNIDGVSDDWQAHPVTDITIQDSLIADPTGQQFGAHTESVSSQWAWYRNVFANSHNRNPLAKINTVFVNNVLYNASAGYTTHTSTMFTHDIVNNYFVFGPASTGTDNTWFQIDKNQAIHYAGNLKDTNRNGLLDGAATTPYWYQGEGTVLASPWSAETTATPPLDAASGARVALSLAGALPRDPIDALVLAQVMTLGQGTTGTGANTVGPDGDLYTSQAQTGLASNGYGAISGGAPPTDSDGDGMPDTWERATGANPAADDAMTKESDGYARIERYASWLAAPPRRHHRRRARRRRPRRLHARVEPRLADLCRGGAPERSGDAAARRPHGALPANRRLHRPRIVRLHGDRRGPQHVHSLGDGARRAVTIAPDWSRPPPGVHMGP